MAIVGINGINLENLTGTQKTTGQSTTQLNHIFEFADNINVGLGDKEPSEAEVKTEILKNSIMKRVDVSKSRLSSCDIKKYLSMLVENAQKLNGIQKNKLKPNGTPEQNIHYDEMIKNMIAEMYLFAEEVPGLSIVQNSKTGLYKLRINDMSFNIPDRSVSIQPSIKTDDGLLLDIVIVD